SGLRNKPCITAPETARDAPTSIPRTARGSRISWMMIRLRIPVASSIPSPLSQWRTSSSAEALEAPAPRLASTMTTRSSASTTMVSRARAERSPAIGATLAGDGANGCATIFSMFSAALAVQSIGKIADGIGGTRSETQQVAAVHADHPARGAGPRLTYRCIGKQHFVRNRRTSTIHHQYGIRCSRNDRLVGKLLVSRKSVDGVGRAGKAHDPVGSRVGACRQNLAALHGQDEENAHALLEGSRTCFRCLEFAVDFGSKHGRLVVHAQRPPYDADSFQYAFAIVALRHLDIGHARLFEHLHRFLRAAALQGYDARWLHRKHSFRREGAHVADIG